jgi:hypothetical protein
MPDSVGIEVRVTLDSAGHLPHELFSVRYCLLESNSPRVLHRAHPDIIDCGPCQRLDAALFMADGGVPRRHVDRPVSGSGGRR